MLKQTITELKKHKGQIAVQITNLQSEVKEFAGAPLGSWNQAEVIRASPKA